MPSLRKRYQKVNLELTRKIMQEPGGENLSKCYQCGTCSASCIVNRYHKEFNPRKIIRMASLGMPEVLESREPWYCAVCYMCTERCPRDVEPASVLRAIKNVAAKEGKVPPSFLAINENILKHGRLFEIDDFTNFLREDMGIPPIEAIEEGELDILLEGTVYKRILKGDGEK